MAGCVVMLGGMLVLGGVAAADVPTLQAGTQMHPRIAHGDALRAEVGFGSGVFAVREMLADGHRFFTLSSGLLEGMLSNPVLSR